MDKKADEHRQNVRYQFAQAYRFFEKHIQPRTDADWDAIAADLAQYRPPLVADLIVALIDEMEREYNHVTRKNKKYHMVQIMELEV